MAKKEDIQFYSALIKKLHLNNVYLPGEIFAELLNQYCDPVLQKRTKDEIFSHKKIKQKSFFETLFSSSSQDISLDSLYRQYFQQPEFLIRRALLKGKNKAAYVKEMMLTLDQYTTDTSPTQDELYGLLIAYLRFYPMLIDLKTLKPDSRLRKCALAAKLYGEQKKHKEFEVVWQRMLELNDYDYSELLDQLSPKHMLGLKQFLNEEMQSLNVKRIEYAALSLKKITRFLPPEEMIARCFADLNSYDWLKIAITCEKLRHLPVSYEQVQQIILRLFELLLTYKLNVSAHIPTQGYPNWYWLGRALVKLPLQQVHQETLVTFFCQRLNNNDENEVLLITQLLPDLKLMDDSLKIMIAKALIPTEYEVENAKILTIESICDALISLNLNQKSIEAVARTVGKFLSTFLKFSPELTLVALRFIRKFHQQSDFRMCEVRQLQNLSSLDHDKKIRKEFYGIFNEHPMGLLCSQFNITNLILTKHDAEMLAAVTILESTDLFVKKLLEHFKETDKLQRLYILKILNKLPISTNGVSEVQASLAPWLGNKSIKIQVAAAIVLARVGISEELFETVIGIFIKTIKNSISDKLKKKALHGLLILTIPESRVEFVANFVSDQFQNIWDEHSLVLLVKILKKLTLQLTQQEQLQHWNKLLKNFFDTPELFANGNLPRVFEEIFSFFERLPTWRKIAFYSIFDTYSRQLAQPSAALICDLYVLKSRLVLSIESSVALQTIPPIVDLQMKRNLMELDQVEFNNNKRVRVGNNFSA